MLLGLPTTSLVWFVSHTQVVLKFANSRDQFSLFLIHPGYHVFAVCALYMCPILLQFAYTCIGVHVISHQFSVHTVHDTT